VTAGVGPASDVDDCLLRCDLEKLLLKEEEADAASGSVGARFAIVVVLELDEMGVCCYWAGRQADVVTQPEKKQRGAACWRATATLPGGEKPRWPRQVGRKRWVVQCLEAAGR
jgi:hypothetical protein